MNVCGPEPPLAYPFGVGYDGGCCAPCAEGVGEIAMVEFTLEFRPSRSPYAPFPAGCC